VKKIICFIIGFTILAAPLAFAQDTTVVNMRSKAETETVEIHMILERTAWDVLTKPVGMTPLQITLNTGTVQPFQFIGEKGNGTFTVKATGGVQNWLLDPGNTARMVVGITTTILAGIGFSALFTLGLFEWMDYGDFGLLIGSGASLGVGIVGLIMTLRNRPTAELVETGL
jgi:hypothetical protein